MKKRLKKHKNVFPLRISIVVVVIVMIIGYATVSTVLDISGNVTIGFKFDDVNIYVGNLYLNNINKYNSINSEKTGFELEITTGTYDMDLYVVNNATQYNEYITLICNDTELNGITITPKEAKEDIIYSQMVLKKLYSIENTGETQTLSCSIKNVEVESETKSVRKKKIIFASDGYENSIAYKYIDSATYGELPVLEKKDFTFLGWYDINDNKIESSTEIQNFSDEVLFAKFDKIKAVFFSYNNEKTNINCTDIQCAITKLNEMVEGGEVK